jgi:hypothetical protein
MSMHHHNQFIVNYLNENGYTPESITFLMVQLFNQFIDSPVTLTEADVEFFINKLGVSPLLVEQAKSLIDTIIEEPTSPIDGGGGVLISTISPGGGSASKDDSRDNTDDPKDPKDPVDPRDPVDPKDPADTGDGKDEGGGKDPGGR